MYQEQRLEEIIKLFRGLEKSISKEMVNLFPCF